MNLQGPCCRAHQPKARANRASAIQENESFNVSEDQRTCEGNTAIVSPEKSDAVVEAWRRTKTVTTAAVTAPASADSICPRIGWKPRKRNR